MVLLARLSQSNHGHPRKWGRTLYDNGCLAKGALASPLKDASVSFSALVPGVMNLPVVLSWGTVTCFFALHGPFTLEGS